MELVVYNPSSDDGFIKKIEWNHEEIKKEVSEKVKMYADLVYTDDQIKEAKADRAKLNKFVQALENKRKEIKKKCLEPYEDFESKVKEIVAIVNKPISLIDNQVKEYEEKKKKEKAEAIEELYHSLPKVEGFEDLSLDKIYDNKWLNATVSLSKVEEAIQERFDKIKSDLEVIEQLQEFSFEAKAVYKDTLNLNIAIGEAKRMSDIQKAKAEEEAKKKQEQEEKEQASFMPKPTLLDELEKAQEPKQVQEAEDKAEWISFKACLTISQAKELKTFFEDRNIDFKAI